ncbi:hypothetical protein GGR56DRAFT_510973 [Xylariaceae sp. FL0804]|nr:hypothetical protein GGR56DRAFT_510973 [Xylariaceae sp. FL0804]
MYHHLTALLACLAQVALAVASSSAALADFAVPPNLFRPRFRYWLPDASVPASVVSRDFQSIADVAGGGADFLGFYNYGLGPALTDWSVYGFGTDAWKQLFTAALETCAANGLELSFALGPNQGAGVPAVPETPGLAKELVYGNATLAGGETFDGAVPAPVVAFNAIENFMNTNELWGTNQLVAVVAAQVEYDINLAEYFWGASLYEDSLIDLTNLTTDGSLSWTAPVGNGTTWKLFAFYERYSMQRECVSVSNATTTLGNGSWMVDHFSASGAKKATDFWDSHMLDDANIKSLVRQVGASAWEDSLEMQSALWWTAGFLDRFEESRGYSLVKYLPLVFQASNQWGGYLPPYNTTYNIGPYSTAANKWTEDYRLTLEEGYGDYVTHYVQWGAEYGVGLRNQPAYNLPLEMARAVPLVPVPELESLGFDDSIDRYRQFTGAAHLAGRDVISTEIGAVLEGSYALSVPALKGLFDNSFAAGVNNLVLHGYAYSGEYVETNWPGYTPFQYEYTEMWGPRQPAWAYLNDTMLYAARNSLVLRAGVPRIDVAFYYYQDPWLVDEIYVGEDFNAAGYTHEYLGPSNLASDQATVVDGILAPDGPAFQALVVYNQTQINVEGSAALVRFAQAGLPIFIVGSTPNTTIGATGQTQVSENIATLLEAASVRVLSDDEFSASALEAAGISPRAKVHATGGDDNATTTAAEGLFTFWVSDADAATDYVYLYNRGAGGVFNMTFNGTASAAPHALDAWTGVQSPVLAYRRGAAGDISMNVSLRTNQSTILAFVNDDDSSMTTERHVVAHSANVAGFRLDDSGRMEALVPFDDRGEVSVVLDNGTTVVHPATRSAARNGSTATNTTTTTTTTTIGPWSLTVQSYGPRGNDTVAPNITTVDVGVLDALAPWTEIPGLERISGVGVYTASFELPPAAVAADAATFVISFGPVLHTLRAWVDGCLLPAVDPADPQVDVSACLDLDLDLTAAGRRQQQQQQQHELRVEVSSTLFNAVKAGLADGSVESIGYGAEDPSLYTDSDWAAYGLVGPVRLGVLRSVVVA